MSPRRFGGFKGQQDNQFTSTAGFPDCLKKYATRRALDQASDIALKVRVDGRPDRVSYALGFEEFIFSISLLARISHTDWKIEGQPRRPLA